MRICSKERDLLKEQKTNNILTRILELHFCIFAFWDLSGLMNNDIKIAMIIVIACIIGIIVIVIVVATKIMINECEINDLIYCIMNVYSYLIKIFDVMDHFCFGIVVLRFKKILRMMNNNKYEMEHLYFTLIILVLTKYHASTPTIVTAVQIYNATLIVTIVKKYDALLFDTRKTPDGDNTMHIFFFIDINNILMMAWHYYLLECFKNSIIDSCSIYIFFYLFTFVALFSVLFHV